MLRGRKIVLRSLQKSDLSFLHSIENNKENWQFGSEQRQYTKEELASYIQNARTDITIAKQYRFIIDLKQSPVGIIDLFDYTYQSVSIGIIIAKNYRNRGFAKEALELVCEYAFSILDIKELYASVSKNNFPSIKLFKSSDFQLQKENKELQYFIKLAEKKL